MNKRYKTISGILFWFSIAVAVAHFIWCGVDGSFDLQSLLLNVIPYGVPIFAYVLVQREYQRESPRWNRTDTLFAALFSLCYLAMVVHVTVAGSINGFINIYFNVPCFYALPLAVFGIIWLGIRIRPQAATPVLGKVLFALPFAAIIVMIAHCGTLAVVGLTQARNTAGLPATSFPWWGMPLLYGILYLFGAGVLFGVYALYWGAQKRKVKQGDDEN